MYWYEYKNQVLEDAYAAIYENIEYYDTWQDMYDSLFTDDSVTGNGSGSYYFNGAKAAEALSGIIFDEEVIARFQEYGYEGIPTEEGAEAVDVIARCIALDDVSGELEEYYDSTKEDMEEDEEELMNEATAMQKEHDEKMEA